MRTIKKSKIMKIKFLALIGVLFLASFVNEVKAQEGMYYFAYAKVYEYSGTSGNLYQNYTGRYLITPVLFSECARTKHFVLKQFQDYMEAEYNLAFESDARVYSTAFFSKADAEEDRRAIMKHAKRITKIYDFEYLCD